MPEIHRPERLATRAASFRNGGRHHPGIPGGIIPLYPGGFVGIRMLGPVINHHNALEAEIDRSLKRMEADNNIVDYRPRFLSGDQKPAHDSVKTWVRGFWKAMALAPETWHALVEDERTQIIIEPFIGFFDLGELEPHDIPASIDDLLDEHAALIPRLVLVLRKLARIQ